uniref:Sodium channel protein type 8 subunit alpha-like n=1 Tax=Cyprinodon variegatus TaxID=28743 RepID=A0A3Q2E2N3_CYPVA
MLVDQPLMGMVVECVLLSIFTLELLVKFLSRGVGFGQFTSLRDPWNWLDILNITVTVFFLCDPFNGLDALRTISRVLKLFSYRPGLKKTVEKLVHSLKELADVMVLGVFVLSILTVLGMQLFMGQLSNRCVMSSPSGMNDTPTPWPYANPNSSEEFAFEDFLCGNSSYARECPDSLCLRLGKNPDHGFTSFDTFGWSLLSVLRILTQDLFDRLMKMTLEVTGKPYVSAYVLIFFPGCFVVVSLIVAAVAILLVKQEDAEAAEAKKAEKEYNRIVKVLKKKEEKEATDGTELLEDLDSAHRKKPAANTKEQEPLPGEDDVDKVKPLCSSHWNRVLENDCCSCSQWLKQKLRPIVMNRFFELGIIICIILNTILMAMEHYPMTPEFENLFLLNKVFLAIYVAEFLLKLLALGVKGYFQVRWHIFDFIIVLSGLLLLMIADVQGLWVLRSVQLLVPLRLGRWWRTLNLLMKITWFSFGNLSRVLFLTFFMFAMVGMKLFKDDDYLELPDWHMDDFVHSILLVFRILCGEWIETMWDCMLVSNDGLCVVYFMLVVFIGNLLVLCLFLSLLLSPLYAKASGGAEGQETNKSQSGPWVPEFFRTLIGKNLCVDTDQKAATSKTNGKEDYLALTVATSEQPFLRDPSNDSTKIQKAANNKENKQECDGVQKSLDNRNLTKNTPGDCCCSVCYNCFSIQDIDTSQGSGKVWFKFRKACLLIVQHRVFEVFMIFIILLSSAALVLEDTLIEPNEVMQEVLDKADLVFTCLFLTEMLLKWIALGFKQYFTSFWCWLDFLVLDVSMFGLIGKTLGYSSNSLKTLRALRTLRVPSRFKGMRVVLQSIAASVPSMCSALLVVLFVWLNFSIMGVNLFAGKFYSCFNVTTKERMDWHHIANKTDCLYIQENNTDICWRNEQFNFDNVGMAFLSLLVMATSAGWKDIMHDAVDSTQVEDQPQFEYRLNMYLYFVLFIIFGCFFCSNLLIRACIDALHKQNKKAGGKHVLRTEQQLKFHVTVGKIFPKSPEKAAPRPQNRCIARLFDLVTAPTFEILVVVVICVKVLLMMMERDDQSMLAYNVMMWFHFIIMILFLIEFILKIIALRQHYFSFGLNILDFVVLIYMILGSFFHDIFEKYLITDIFILRLLRISRVLPLIPWTKRLQKLIIGFIMSIPALLNIGLVIFLVVYTYSFVGMCTFCTAVMECWLYNFDTFGNSMISMITVTTSSHWNCFLYSIMEEPVEYDLKTPDSSSDFGRPYTGIFFFSSYMLLYLLLVIHLFIAVVMESFNSIKSEDSNLLQMFYKTWRKFDPNALQVIQYTELSDFCDALPAPLRIPKPNSIQLNHMDLPLLAGDQICCFDVLRALMTQAFGESAETEALQARLKEKFNNAEKVSREPVSSTLKRKQEQVAAAVIQRAFRKHQVQNRADETPDQAVGETTDVLVSSH